MMKMPQQATDLRRNLGALPSPTECKYLTIIDLLFSQAIAYPDQLVYTFLRSQNIKENLTIGELHKRAIAIAARLQSLDTFGQRALLIYPPGLDFIIAFFGCLYAGVIAVPAYPPRQNQSLKRLQLVGADAQATIVLTTASLKSSLEERAANDLSFSPDHWIATDSLVIGNENEWHRPWITPDSLAFIQYTSGSTGNPKGVMISHGNLLHNLEVIYNQFGHSPESRGVIWLPQYHDMGLIGGILQPLYGGFPVRLMSPVDFLQKPLRWLQAISDFKATTSGGPNFAYELCCTRISRDQLVNLDLSAWEVAFTGAEPIRAETLDLFSKTFAPYGFRREAFYPCYGMAESTLMASGGSKETAPTVIWVDRFALEQHRVDVQDRIHDTAKPIVSCGRATKDQKIAIVSPNTFTGCADGEVGEIWLQSNSVALGYWNATELTHEVFQGYRKDTQEGPFLRTGDLGFLAKEELFITGRIKDVIIIRGQNHYPQDIESTVADSDVSLCPNAGAAFSMEGKKAELLAIVQEVKRNQVRRLDSQSVIAKIRQNVIAIHGINPHIVVLVKPGGIPKTSSGKIQRRACRTALSSRTLKIIDDWCENPKRMCKYASLKAEIDATFEKLNLGTNLS